MSLSYLSSLTPITSVMSGSFAGAEIEHLLRAGLEVLRSALAVGEEAGRLDDDVHSEIRPRKRLRVALAEHLEGVALHADLAVRDLDAFEPAVRGVVVQQVREDLRRGEIVHRDDLEVSATLDVRANEVRPMRPNPLMPTFRATDLPQFDGVRV